MRVLCGDVMEFYVIHVKDASRFIKALIYEIGIHVENNTYVCTKDLLTILKYTGKICDRLKGLVAYFCYKNNCTISLSLLEEFFADREKLRIELYKPEKHSEPKEDGEIRVSSCDPGFQLGIWMNRTLEFLKELGIEVIDKKEYTHEYCHGCDCVFPQWAIIKIRASKIQKAILKLALSVYSGVDVVFGAGARKILIK